MKNSENMRTSLRAWDVKKLHKKMRTRKIAYCSVLKKQEIKHKIEKKHDLVYLSSSWV
jgi:hypothetical protein